MDRIARSVGTRDEVSAARIPQDVAKATCATELWNTSSQDGSAEVG